MRRTTTPTYIFTFPFNISAIDQMTITFAQGSRKIVKTKADGTILDTKFNLTLTQAETKQFCDGNCKVQIKLASGQTVLASTIFEAKVRSILDDTLFVLPDTESEQTEEISTQSVPISAIEGAEVLIDEIPQEFTVTFTEAVIIGGGSLDLPLNYADDSQIYNKPSINGHEIVGAMSSAELDISASDISVDDSSIYWSTEVDNAQEALDLLAEDTYKAGNKAVAVASDLTSHEQDIQETPSAYDNDVHIKTAERTAWNSKYSKPNDGIPKTDLASGVQDSLGLADTAVQPSALTGKEDTSNKVTSLSDSSTDTQYPSAKCTYDAIQAHSGVVWFTEWEDRLKLSSAISNGFLVCHRNVREVYVYQYYTSDSNGISSIVFASSLDGNMKYATLTSTGFAYTSVSLSTSVTSSSTDTEYPTAKATYTAVSAKYTLPSGGIPSTDMTQAVQDSLGHADTAVQPSALSDYVSNTELGNMIDLTVDSTSDDDHIPTSKAVYLAIQSAVSASILTALNTPV